MATIFTVPLKGQTITVKAGALGLRTRRILKRAFNLKVERVEVFPYAMHLHGVDTRTDRWRWVQIDNPNMIEWND